MKRKRVLIPNFWLLVLFGLLWMGCGRVILYNNLNQEDANKVMVLLQGHGIEAVLEQEVKQNEVFWSIKVNKDVLAKAREIIVASHVISPRAPGLQEVYQGKGSSGWIKTPAEERARYLLALKGEIVNSLKKLPDVVDVDVVLNVPQEDTLGLKDKKHSTASVVIKALASNEPNSSLNEVQIQQFVANAIEGMNPRDVAVLLHFMAPVGTKLLPGQTVLLPKGVSPSQAKPKAEEGTEKLLMGLRLDQDSKDRLKVYLIVFCTVLVVISIALILSIVQVGRMRQELKGLRSGPQRPALEGEVLEGEAPPRLQAGTKEEVE